MTDLATPKVWMKISPACDVNMCDKILDLKNKSKCRHPKENFYGLQKRY
jgi:hypothetical protein